MIDEVARSYPLPRTSPNATPVADNRGDVGFGQEPIMAWHEQGAGKRPAFHFKLKLTATVKRAIAAIPCPKCQFSRPKGFCDFVKSFSNLRNPMLIGQSNIISPHSFREVLNMSKGKC